MSMCVGYDFDKLEEYQNLTPWMWFSLLGNAQQLENSEQISCSIDFMEKFLDYNENLQSQLQFKAEARHLVFVVEEKVD